MIDDYGHENDNDDHDNECNGDYDNDWLIDHDLLIMMIDDGDILV